MGEDPAGRRCLFIGPNCDRRISVRLHRLSPDRCFHSWSDIPAVDTTFAWASGELMVLLLDPWNVRLIPHYSLAVLFVISHLAMGLRRIMLANGVLTDFSNRIVRTICALALIVSLVITIAQLRCTPSGIGRLPRRATRTARPS